MFEKTNRESAGPRDRITTPAPKTGTESGLNEVFPIRISEKKTFRTLLERTFVSVELIKLSKRSREGI